MSERILILGKRYKLDHGYGVLLGREVWDDKRENTALDTQDLAEGTFDRFVFMLEKGHNWASGSFPHDNEPKKYVAWGDQIKEIDDER